MTYQVLKIVLEWAVRGGHATEKNGSEYQKALAELAVALKRVMRFN